ncbi:MAG: D-alanine--D-alanine ligase family protein [Planctomycetaceae bacterium]
MKRLRVLTLVPEGHIPPRRREDVSEERLAEVRMESDISGALAALGHDVTFLGLHDDLGPLRDGIKQFAPDIVFNLLEGFHGFVAFDQNVVAYLELLRVPYTGCNPRGLVLARDKALTKKILAYHRIPVPGFQVFPRGRPPRPPPRLAYPLIVKSLTEEGSFGIAQASLVRNGEKLVERVEMVHERVESDAVAEEYIEGRELYLALYGNRRVHALPLWELVLDNLPDGAPRIATERVKHDEEYQEKHKILSQPVRDLPPETLARIARLGRRVYKSLELSGYARLDLRLREDGKVFVIEANPNPDLSLEQEFSDAAAAAGIRYDRLIQRVLDLGLRYHEEWSG